MKLEIKIFVVSYILLIVTMFVLPFFSAEGYSIVKHTTSQLGAQKTPNSWVMNIMFALMGITSIWAGWENYEGFWFQRILLLIFGISLVFVAFYGHAPITEGVAYSVKSDQLHSLFASTTGFSFTVLAISTAFIKDSKPEMTLPILIGVLATILSLLMFKLENFMGIWQRLMFISTFGWMIYEFNK
jgi:hypothetical membrane protein